MINTKKRKQIIFYLQSIAFCSSLFVAPVSAASMLVDGANSIPVGNSASSREPFAASDYIIATATNSTSNITIGNGSTDTIYFNTPGSSKLFSIGANSQVTVNGNIDISMHGLSGDAGGTHHFGQNSTTNFNGNVNITNENTAAGAWIAEQLQNYMGTVNFNGDLNIKQTTNSASGSTSALISRGGNITVNGDAYIYTKVNTYAPSGANGVYARTEGDSSNGTLGIGHITFNGDKTTIISISNKPDAISAKKWDPSYLFAPSPSVHIDSNTTQVVGTINVFMGDVTAHFKGTDSFWYGDSLTDSYYIASWFGLRGWNTGTITISDGAEWGYFGDVKGDYKGKGIKALALTDGGIINLYDEYLQEKWQTLGLLDMYDETNDIYPDIRDTKHDYVYIGELSGHNGIFQLDLNSTNRTASDMIYIGEYNGTNTADYLLQSYPADDLVNVSRENPLRFATVGGNAGNLVFKDSVNIHGKYLFDYKAKIDYAPYKTTNATAAGNAYEYHDLPGVTYYFDDVYNNALYNQRIGLNDIARPWDGLTPGTAEYNFWHENYEARMKNYESDLKEIKNLLVNGSTNWIIYSTEAVPNDKADVVYGDYDAMYGEWMNNDTLRKRLGEVRDAIVADGIWTRVIRGKQTGDLFKLNYTTYQIGYDRFLPSKSGEHKGWAVGSAFAYTTSDNTYNVYGNGDSKMKVLSLYGVKKYNENENLDIIFDVGRLEGTQHIYLSEETLYGKRSNNAIRLSVEYNKKIPIHGNGTFIEPQAQLVWGHINGYNFHLNDQLQVNGRGINSLIGRLGVLYGKDFKRGNAYLKGSLLHEFSGNGGIELASLTSGASVYTPREYGDTWFELGFGSNYQLGKDEYIYFDMERNFGAKITKKWQVEVGLRKYF